MSTKFLHNKTKLIFQLAIYILLIALLIIGFVSTEKPDFEGYCPFGGILSFGSKVWLGSMSCQMSENQVFMGLALILSVILVGKLFCGYLCPIGTLIEWLNKLGKRFKLGFFLTGVLDRILRLGKYILLFFTAYFTITASELWCKKFDPYFAAVTGFGPDTVLFWGILTLFAVLILSVLIRFFWCKYVCPLAALSNIFANILITAPIIVLYIILRVAGLNIGILWLILALCVTGAATEIFRFRFFSISPFKIQIDEDHCTQCGICDENCPQGIPVSSYSKVTHPDCTLCLDCVKGCSVENSISLSKMRSTWIPPVVIIGLIIAAIILANVYQFKTLSEKWGDYKEISTLTKIEIGDLKSVKCWGSAKSLQNKLMRKKGIYGLDAYAKDHRIIIYYDSSVLDTFGVKRAIFRPSKYKLRKIKDYKPQTLAVLEIGVNGIWDIYDNMDLFRMLAKNSDIYGFETNFGEPVFVKIVYELDKISKGEIIEIIEQDSYIRIIKGKEEVIEVDFDCEGKGTVIDTLEYAAFRKDYFGAYDQKYNNYEDYKPENLKIFEIGFPDAENIMVRRSLKYLTGHVSLYDGTVRLRTQFSDRPVLRIYFDPLQVDSAQIHEKLLEPELTFLTSKNEEKHKKNIFTFEETARVVDYTDKTGEK